MRIPDFQAASRHTDAYNRYKDELGINHSFVAFIVACCLVLWATTTDVYKTAEKFHRGHAYVLSFLFLFAAALAPATYFGEAGKCAEDAAGWLGTADGNATCSLLYDRVARQIFAEHLIATKALRCTATAWIPHCR